MRIFVSYAREDRDVAEAVAVRLQQEDHHVYFDRGVLKPGEGYDEALRRFILDSDIFVFLISPDSVAAGRYTLTELKFARQRWPNPNGRVLPVLARSTPDDAIPPFLRAIGILKVEGNLPAEVVAEVQRMTRRRKPIGTAASAGVLVAVVLVAAFVAYRASNPDPAIRPTTPAPAPDRAQVPVTSEDACAAFPALVSCRFPLAVDICATYASIETATVPPHDNLVPERREILYTNTSDAGSVPESERQFQKNVKLVFLGGLWGTDVRSDDGITDQKSYWEAHPDAMAVLSAVINANGSDIPDGESRLYYGLQDKVLDIDFRVEGSNWRLTRDQHEAAFAYASALRAPNAETRRRYLDRAVSKATDVCAQ